MQSAKVPRSSHPDVRVRDVTFACRDRKKNTGTRDQLPEEDALNLLHGMQNWWLRAEHGCHPSGTPGIPSPNSKEAQGCNPAWHSVYNRPWGHLENEVKAGIGRERTRCQTWVAFQCRTCSPLRKAGLSTEVYSSIRWSVLTDQHNRSSAGTSEGTYTCI